MNADTMLVVGTGVQLMPGYKWGWGEVHFVMQLLGRIGEDVKICAAVCICQRG